MNVFSYYGANHLTYGRMGGGEGAVEGLDFYGFAAYTHSVVS